MKKEVVKKELYEFGTLLKENGFTVIVSKNHPFEWLFFEKSGKFGTVSPASFFGYNFGTVHKPSRECGTGYGTDREVDLTIGSAEIALQHAAHWADREQTKVIQKYSSIEEFINSSINRWAEYYIL